MVEELLVLAILAEEKLVKQVRFQTRLDTYFINNPENSLLLELESLSQDTCSVFIKSSTNGRRR
ncbi:hypothetical protein IGI37_002462 [Enterococcus sp. AZ194]